MTDQTAESPGLEGRMYLYEQPEPLSLEEHGTLGLTEQRHYRFAATAQTLPLAMTEFRSAQRHFPIVFTNPEKPMPLIVTGLSKDKNLFVDTDGNWREGVYVPAYLRCYPFALATTGPEQYALVIDRQSDMITENPSEPFFAGDGPSESTQKAIDFCQQFRMAREQTEAFGAKLVELELLTLQGASSTEDGEKRELARYYGVDAKRLENLAHEQLSALMGDGSLAAIMAHLFSLDNWAALDRLRKSG